MSERRPILIQRSRIERQLDARRGREQMDRALKPVVEQPEIVLTRGMPLVIGKATHSKMLSASFLADLQEDYERYGKGIFALMRERFPTKYFDALVV